MLGSVLGNYYLRLNTTDSRGDTWASLSSSLVMFNTLSSWTTENNSNHVAYCFAEIPGYSKFGSFVANASADGTFIPLLFEAGWFFCKRIDSTGDWFIWDCSRVGYNPSNEYLLANSTNVEGTTDYLDICSNGVKFRTAISGTYIYGAISKRHFKYSNAR